MQPPHRRRLLSRKKVHHTKSGFSVRSFSSDKSFLTQLTCIKILDIPENNWLHHERKHEATILKSAMDISDKNPYGNGLLYAGFNQVRKEETSKFFSTTFIFTYLHNFFRTRRVSVLARRLASEFTTVTRCAARRVRREDLGAGSGAPRCSSGDNKLDLDLSLTIVLWDYILTGLFVSFQMQLHRPGWRWPQSQVSRKQGDNDTEREKE